MSRFPRLTVAEQTAAHLREGFIAGRWSGTLPGVTRLAAELDVSPPTVRAALRQLEGEGLLTSQGAGRSRLIVPARDTKVRRDLRLAILLSEPPDRHLKLVIELQRELEAEGHTALFAPKTLLELGSDLELIGRVVDQAAADAWVICAGSRKVLGYFCRRPEPSFALFGRRERLPIPATGPDKPPAFTSVTRRLIELGHQRIALLCRKVRRLPSPGTTEQAFLTELEAHGIAPGPFNLPDWEESVAGFQELLVSLFRVTPPTALIVDEAPLYVATQQFLAGKGIRVPGEVSLVCTDSDPAFDWCEPPVSHIRWDSVPVIRHIVGWAGSLNRGNVDLRQTLVPAEFVEGGTIEPAPQEE